MRRAAWSAALLACALAAPAGAGTPPPADLHRIQWFVHTDLVDGATPLSWYEALIASGLADARTLIEGSQGPADTVCCQKLASADQGAGVTLSTFGTPLDGLDQIGPGEFALLEALGQGSRGYIVEEISDCGGVPALGCASLPACAAVQPPDDDPDVIMVVSLDAVALGATGLVIAHERGHNACLLHVPEPAEESCSLMRDIGGGGCLDAAQCAAFSAARQAVGGTCACHDGPLQEVDGLACTDDALAGVCSGGLCGAPGSDASVVLLAAGGPEGPTGAVPNDPLRLSGLTGGWSDRGYLHAAKGLEFDPDANVLYAIEEAAGDDLLVRLEPTEGTKIATIGPITGAEDVIALAFDPGPTPAPGDDRLLALSSVGGFEDLLEIDPQTAAPSFLGSLALGVTNGFQGLAYDDVHQRLYASGFAGSGLYEIDLASCPWFCEVIEVTSVSLAREVSSLAYARSTGKLYLVGAVQGQTRYDRIDTVTLTAETGVGIDAFTPGGLAAVPVPEPDARLALAAGAALLAGLRRRRRHLRAPADHSLATPGDASDEVADGDRAAAGRLPLR